ncbi:hypothetical protein ACEWX3_06570 [Mycobacterium sp. G7A2]|uniref:hypothetical protein n=1 Tax=Mycobacterium sp. G7A2 TaxID=3317307 RepID=UPI0035A95D95
MFQAVNDIGSTVPARGGTYWSGEPMHSKGADDLDEVPEALAVATAAVARNAVHRARTLKNTEYPPCTSLAAKGALMPDNSLDPVDHSRTARQHAGETMKAGVNAPGLIATGVGVVAFFFGLAAFATGEPMFGTISVVLAVLLIGGGMTWVVTNHRKTHDRQKDWHREHPEVPYEPPTS